MAAPIDPRADVDDRHAGFVALAAHELRAPATVVHGIAATLDVRGDELDADRRRLLHEMLHAQTTRLVRLIEQLLDLSRLDDERVRIERRRFAVRERVERLVESVAGDRSGEVEIGVAPGLETVVDPDAFDRILSNLVTNALRHGDAPVRVTAEQADRHLRVTVEDAGRGVAPDFRDRLFDRFSRDTRDDGAREGAGLGLSIARRYASAHGGSIVYEDAEAHGARFRVVIPAPRVEH